MHVSDLHHVALNVSDTARALDFYVGVLGLEVLPRPDFPFPGAWLGVGPTRQIHLVETEVPEDRGQHVAFAVADLDAAIDELRAAGVEVRGPRPVGDGPMRQAFVRDPDGNRLELNSG